MKNKALKTLIVAGILALSTQAHAGFDWEGAEDFPPKPTFFAWFGW